MAYNEQLTDRLREALEVQSQVEEKKMFRGITFMVNGKMCISVGNDEIMCRIDPALLNELVEKKWVPDNEDERTRIQRLVNEEIIKTKKELQYWVDLSLAFNKLAKASKKNI